MFPGPRAEPAKRGGPGHRRWQRHDRSTPEAKPREREASCAGREEEERSRVQGRFLRGEGQPAGRVHTCCFHLPREGQTGASVTGASVRGQEAAEAGGRWEGPGPPGVGSTPSPGASAAPDGEGAHLLSAGTPETVLSPSMAKGKAVRAPETRTTGSRSAKNKGSSARTKTEEARTEGLQEGKGEPESKVRRRH